MLVTVQASKKRQTLTLEIPENLPKIQADEMKTREILYNLLSNAIKFTPEHGTLGVRAKQVGPAVEIEVWDNGIGIAPENLSRIFEGFFRVDSAYTRATEGTGLGLALSKKLAELHGGTLTVESKGLNQGTLVRVSLPIAGFDVGPELPALIEPA